MDPEYVIFLGQDLDFRSSQHLQKRAVIKIVRDKKTIVTLQQHIRLTAF